jgi:phospholipid-binding lipoprotein MlaA
MAGLRMHKTLVVTFLLVGLMGCASNDPRDPWEGYNRTVHGFNEGLDRAILKPVAKGYRAITPEPVDRGITNFFSNINDISSAANNLLQLKIHRAISDLGRVAINSTIGILGFIDVASGFNLKKYGEDFGQTLGRWGVGPGPYMVLPFFGPRTLRDTVGMVGDWYLDPIAYAATNDWPRNWEYGFKEDWQWQLLVLKYIDTRADMLGATDVLDVAALDQYTFVRDAYLQHREALVRDANLDTAASTPAAGSGDDW